MRVSEAYNQIIDKARWSHAHGRSVFHIEQPDSDFARLFSYAYRSQTIGTFHATRVAIEANEKDLTDAHVQACLDRARVLLEQLEAHAIDPVPRDFRSLVSTLYYYDRWVNEVIGVLEMALARGPNPRLETIRLRFLRNLEPVTAGNGLYVATDTKMPDQGTFLVPNLNISILPLIYGDYHSWNAAYLVADRPGVSLHRHRKGAEIHLGFSPVRGRTILGPCLADVEEGYAMPIPPMSDHGFLNTSGHEHVLPFVFGSLLLGGWGVFFDVEPRPQDLVRMEEHHLESAAMNHSVFLDRVIRRLLAAKATRREVIVPAERAGSDEIGGLELALTRVGHDGIDLSSESYKIVSVQAGKGRVRLGATESEISEHDYFGVPADLTCYLTQVGESPLVFLEAMMMPLRCAGRALTAC